MMPMMSNASAISPQVVASSERRIWPLVSRWTMAASVSRSFAASSRTACITSRECHGISTGHGNGLLFKSIHGCGAACDA